MNDADIKNSNVNYLNYVLTNTNTTGITIKREKRYTPVSYTHLDVYKRQVYNNRYLYVLFFETISLLPVIFKYYFSTLLVIRVTK